MTPRERVLKALNFEETDRVPKDLGGMLSTGVSAFAYPGLVKALGLPERLPRVHDSFQMLALPDLDVLDALDCDVVTINGDVTNAFDQPGKWKPYDFAGRLPALVHDPDAYEDAGDGAIRQYGSSLMVKDAYVFDAEHGGQPLSWDGEIPRDDLEEVRERAKRWMPGDGYIQSIKDVSRRVRESSDRAVFISCPIGTGMGIGAMGGLGVFPMLCVTDPDYVHAYHEIMTVHAVEIANRILPDIAPNVDVIMMAADDWGTQGSTIASPAVFRELFLPYIRRTIEACHHIAPDVKIFLHCCGAVYSLIDSFVECGFDVLNPVQWSAGEPSFREWKDKARNRIALWGGGVNAQVTLATGTVDDVVAEVREVVPYMKQDGGYIFNNIHNLLAEVPPEMILAMYRTAAEF